MLLHLFYRLVTAGVKPLTYKIRPTDYGNDLVNMFSLNLDRTIMGKTM
jgi:hypothetical protein